MREENSQLATYFFLFLQVIWRMTRNEKKNRWNFHSSPLTCLLFVYLFQILKKLHAQVLKARTSFDDTMNEGKAFEHTNLDFNFLSGRSGASFHNFTIFTSFWARHNRKKNFLTEFVDLHNIYCCCRVEVAHRSGRRKFSYCEFIGSIRNRRSHKFSEYCSMGHASFEKNVHNSQEDGKSRNQNRIFLVVSFTNINKTSIRMILNNPWWAS